jgi:ABC-type multidrug transport system fused ATPase/permease subunit
MQVSQAVQISAFQHQTLSSAQRLMWLEDHVASALAAVSGDRPPPTEIAERLRLSGVSFQYPGTAKYAVDGVNLDIPTGSLVAVVGANGAGKSTFIKLLAGLYEPACGEILIDGVPLAALDQQKWYDRTTACFQDFARLEFEVRDSVGAGFLAKRRDEQAVRTAIELGAADFVNQLGRGLRTPLGRSFEDGAELSGGQWQRIALARSRMREQPCLLLLDEPTAALDPIAEEEVLSRYLGAARTAVATTNGITFFASHRLSMARSADLIVVIDSGKIAQLGHHADLMAQRGGIYHDIYTRQALAYK